MWRSALVICCGLFLLLFVVAIPSSVTMPENYPANVVHYIVIHHAASGSADFNKEVGARRASPVVVKPGRSGDARVAPTVIRTPLGKSTDITAAQIDVLHRARGFDEIGYNYVVRFDGTVEKGRAEDLRGAHARAWDQRGVSYNASSIGICFSGNCDAARWTEAQQRAGYALLVELMRRYNVPPERVIGHRECGNDTHCPGELIDMDKVREKLRTLEREDLVASP